MSPEKRRHAHGARRLRIGRASLANQIYHVTTATADRQPLFVDLIAGRIVVKTMMREARVHRVRTLAYALMPDHLHWLLQLPSGRRLATCVNNVKSLSSRAINVGTGRQGAIWQKGFYDHALRREEDIRSTARYLVRNPLRAGIVDDIRRYPLWDAVWVDGEFEL